ncbi:hypothetical protein [Plebeiibacterium sediminum]|uniref:Uncharacterized protein n=1 Tax=Plebeiibacterium sediminum TaxID=2992112 RepID=A0AAE3SGE4_9BACT|nr:hypothetical protein [Plebeiobacterium sediminum]MCW3788251.1 hypothetical protein [Plebeiobacterium sediminum]
MKKLLIASIVLFFLGLILKLIHYPSSIIIFLGTGLFFIYSIIFFIKGIKEKKALSFALLSSSFFLMYILARLFYWTTIPLFGISLYLIIGFGLGLLSFIHVKAYRSSNLWGIITMICLFVCSVILTNISTDKIYYFFNIRDLVNNSCGNLMYDMDNWDHYSWFLYCEGDYTGALEANEIAKTAAMEFNKQTDGGVASYLEELKERNSQIKTQSWEEYK